MMIMLMTGGALFAACLNKAKEPASQICSMAKCALLVVMASDMWLILAALYGYLSGWVTLPISALCVALTVCVLAEYRK